MNGLTKFWRCGSNNVAARVGMACGGAGDGWAQCDIFSWGPAHRVVLNGMDSTGWDVHVMQEGGGIHYCHSSPKVIDRAKTEIESLCARVFLEYQWHFADVHCADCELFSGAVDVCPFDFSIRNSGFHTSNTMNRLSSVSWNSNSKKTSYWTIMYCIAGNPS